MFGCFWDCAGLVEADGGIHFLGHPHFQFPVLLLEVKSDFPQNPSFPLTDAADRKSPSFYPSGRCVSDVAPASYHAFCSLPPPLHLALHRSAVAPQGLPSCGGCACGGLLETLWAAGGAHLWGPCSVPELHSLLAGNMRYTVTDEGKSTTPWSPG